MPYKPTGRPNGRPAAPPPIVPAAPAIQPPQGSLEETIMLGDAASISANPATKLRWFATRAEIQQVIARDEVGKAKSEVATVTAAMAGLQEQLKTANDEITRLSEKISGIESAHASQLESERRRTDEAVERANKLDKQVTDLKPLAAKWTALHTADASRLGALAKQEAKQREIAEVKKALLPYDHELEKPSGQWIRLQLTGDAKEQYLEKERILRHRLTELTETGEEKQLRLIKEAKEQKDRGEAARNYPKIGDTIERDPADLQPIRYVRDRVANEPMPRMPNKLYGYEPIWDGCNMYGTKGQ